MQSPIWKSNGATCFINTLEELPAFQSSGCQQHHFMSGPIAINIEGFPLNDWSPAMHLYVSELINNARCWKWWFALMLQFRSNSNGINNEAPLFHKVVAQLYKKII